MDARYNTPVRYLREEGLGEVPPPFAADVDSVFLTVEDSSRSLPPSIPTDVMIVVGV